MKWIKLPFLAIYSVWAYFWFFFIGILCVLMYIPVLIFSRRNTDERLYVINHLYEVLWSPIAFMRYTVMGREYFKSGQAYVIVGNHKVTADMFIIAHALRGIPFRPLGKKELLYAPVIGFLFRYALVAVDRTSPESRRRSILIMEKLIQERLVSILILPEGTRNRSNKPLKEFYDGAFRVAIETQTPIIPMVQLDTDLVTPPRSPLIIPVRMTVHFLEPIVTQGLTLADLDMLKEKVYRIMETNILEHWWKTGRVPVGVRELPGN